MDHDIRLAVLEHKQQRLEADMERMASKVDEIHEIMTQAKGVRWLLIASAGFVGLGTTLVAHLWK